MQNVLYVLYFLYILCFRWLLSSGPWNSKNQPSARVILLCITVWCWVILNTRVSNGFTAIHFPQKPSTAVIAWTWSWLGRHIGAFVVSPDTVWYARVLLLFSASAMTDTGSICNESHWSWRYNGLCGTIIISIMVIISIISICMI